MANNTSYVESRKAAREQLEYARYFQSVMSAELQNLTIVDFATDHATPYRASVFAVLSSLMASLDTAAFAIYLQHIRPQLIATGEAPKDRAVYFPLDVPINNRNPLSRLSEFHSETYMMLNTWLSSSQSSCCSLKKMRDLRHAYVHRAPLTASGATLRGSSSTIKFGGTISGNRNAISQSGKMDFHLTTSPPEDSLVATARWIDEVDEVIKNFWAASDKS